MIPLVWLFGALVAFFFTFLLYMVYTFQQRARYFQERDIPYLGAGLHRTLQFFTGSTNLVKVEMEIYSEATQSKSPIVGLSDFFGTPSVYVTDLDLIRAILVKDFDYFVNRRLVKIEGNRYLTKMLLSMQSDQWKAVRVKLSPCFTSGKIRKMFAIFQRSSEKMNFYLRRQMKGSENSMELNFSQIFSKYAMDVIAASAFGVDSQCWDGLEPGQMSTFERMGKQCQVQFTAKVLLKMMLMLLSPKLFDWLGLEAMDQESFGYFASVIQSVMKSRRHTGERKEDFLQLMMDAQQDLLKVDKESTQDTTSENVRRNDDDLPEINVTFDDDDVTANAILFLLAGFDPTQSLLLFTIYNLATEPQAQEKLFELVKSARDQNSGNLTYDAIVEITYLDWIINETMRLFPPQARTERCCNKDYLVPGTNFVIEKGTIVSLPIHPVHHNPVYFPNPGKFIPERFSIETKGNRHPYAFLPFGHGPRNCIGNRFALVKVKTVIATLISSYKFTACSKTTIPVEFDINANLKPKGGMCFNVTLRSS